jgi:putative membrane protein
MARAIRPAERPIPESIEGEMRSYGLNTEAEIHEVFQPPYWDEGMYRPEVNGRDVAKGALAGAISGLVACWVMVQFQKAWSKAEEAAQRRRAGSRNLDEHGVPEHRAIHPEGEQDKQPDDATVKTAEVISEALFGHRLSREEKQIAGPAVHYAFGAIMGALYGATVETTPAARAGFGTAFGAVVFVGADEIGVPAMGLSPKVDVALSKHFYGFASHLVYGVATEAVRRPVRRALDGG